MSHDKKTALFSLKKKKEKKDNIYLIKKFQHIGAHNLRKLKRDEKKNKKEYGSLIIKKK